MSTECKLPVEKSDSTPMWWWVNFCKEFNHNDGLPYLKTNHNAVMLSDGVLYFDTEEDMIMFLLRWS